MTAKTAPEQIFLPPEDAALFGRKYGHPAIGTVCVGDPAVEYVKRELVDLKDTEITRLRGALDAIETATATGDGLPPDETIRVNQVAHRAVATAAGDRTDPKTDRQAHHAERYGRTKVAKIIGAYDDLRRAVRERDLEAAEAALDRYEPWADYALGRLADLPKEP